MEGPEQERNEELEKKQDLNQEPDHYQGQDQDSDHYQGQDKDQEMNHEQGPYQDQGQNPREEIFSRAVRAGKRTYFFDVKATRRNDFYLTITESKKRFNKRGRHYFEKFKIFLYKEDFDKFSEGLEAAIDFIKDAYSKEDFNGHDTEETSVSAEDYTHVEFDDLKEN